MRARTDGWAINFEAGWKNRETRTVSGGDAEGMRGRQRVVEELWDGDGGGEPCTRKDKKRIKWI